MQLILNTYTNNSSRKARVDVNPWKSRNLRPMVKPTHASGSLVGYDFKKSEGDPVAHLHLIPPPTTTEAPTFADKEDWG